MIPLIDLLIRSYIKEGLKRLRENPNKVREYFAYATDNTKNDIARLLQDYEVNVLSGYPREPNSLPCIIVSIAGEDEVEYGIGNGRDTQYPERTLGNDNYLTWENEDNSKYIIENAQIRAQIRVEVWSDNAVITSFLYAVAKYCIFSARNDMERKGLYNTVISGGDLEPMPEYMTTFIYRRAILVNFEYEMGYHVEDLRIGEEEDHFPLGTTIDDIEVRSSGYREGENDD